MNIDMNSSVNAAINILGLVYVVSVNPTGIGQRHSVLLAWISCLFTTHIDYPGALMATGMVGMTMAWTQTMSSALSGWHRAPLPTDNIHPCWPPTAQASCLTWSARRVVMRKQMRWARDWYLSCVCRPLSRCGTIDSGAHINSTHKCPLTPCTQLTLVWHARITKRDCHSCKRRRSCCTQTHAWNT